ncbi:MAG: hypothetical protein QNI84_09305 [Henriciella sp.]|nr:hypothetical protein [Henriciella sp.]
MRAAAIISTLVVALSAPLVALAETPLAERLGEGSTLFWSSVYDGGADEGYSDKLLLKAGDAELYLTGELDEFATSDSFFMLYSGILYRSCAQDLPTEAEQEALAGLWPLSEGAEVRIESDGGATVTVGAPVEYFLMGKTRPAHVVDVKYDATTEEDNLDENLIILDEAKITAQVNWEDGAFDRLMLVTAQSGPQPFSPEAMELLDKCLPFVTGLADPQQE